MLCFLLKIMSAEGNDDLQLNADSKFIELLTACGVTTQLTVGYLSIFWAIINATMNTIVNVIPRVQRVFVHFTCMYFQIIMLVFIFVSIFMFVSYYRPKIDWILFSLFCCTTSLMCERYAWINFVRDLEPWMSYKALKNTQEFGNHCLSTVIALWHLKNSSLS